MDIPQRDLVGACLKRGKVQIKVDSRIPGVYVPPDLANTPTLVLNLSWGFENANMTLEEDAIEATLHFKRVPFRIRIPWGAIWACSLYGESRVDFVWVIETSCLACQGHGINKDASMCAKCDGSGFLKPREPATRPPLVRLVVDNPSPPEKAPEPVSMPSEGTPTKVPWLRLVK